MNFPETPYKKIHLYGLAVITRLLSDIPWGILFLYLLFQRKGMGGLLDEIVNVVLRLTSDFPIVARFIDNFIQKDGSGGFYDALLNAGVFTAFCLLHSMLARDFAKRIMAKLVEEKYVRSLYSIIAGITLLLVIYLWRPLTGTLWATSGVLFWSITVMYCVFILLLLISLTCVDYTDFLGIRSIIGRVNKKSPPASQLSIRGFLAHCRHPIYLCTIFIFWLAPVMTYERLEFAILGIIYYFIGSFLEERNLQRDMGEAYSQYKKNVPMWIPRLTPWRPDEQSIRLNSE